MMVKHGPAWTWTPRALGAFLIVVALPLIIGGVDLMLLGGSFYYLLAGIGVLTSGVLIFMRRPLGAWIYGLVFVLTIAWALWEVGPHFWPLLPRLAAPATLAIPILLVSPSLSRGGRRAAPAMIAFPLAVALVIGLGAGAVRLMTLQPVLAANGASADIGFPGTAAVPPPADNEWRAYGRTSAGTRFAPFDQIDRSNVHKLEVAWTFRMGAIPDIEGNIPPEEQNTPLQVGDTLYICNGVNIVFALDAESGKQRWRFDPNARTPTMSRCRGVSYYEMPAQAASAENLDAACLRRIVLTTVDARMIELDAATGKPCAGFGKGGTIDLKVGIGDNRPGYYYLTSAPTVARNLVIIGGWVMDNQEVNEPSGVVRAFDARTGALVWAWDMERPDRTGLPPPGEIYTKGTPNVWGTPAFDDKLGLVYLPTGNRTPDFWGGGRSKIMDDHTSAIVALDIATGRERWVYSTVHHDVWDYDVTAQPALYDVPDGRGGTIPALAQATKRGQIFLLDRRNGRPIAKVVEMRVPTRGAPKGDWLAPTQPYSVGMPSFGTEPLTEATMWGATPYDQLWCRIAFRRLGYQGEFTPNSTQEMLIYPGFLGGFNWGGASIDESRGYLIVNDMRMPLRQRLVPRAEADPRMRKAGKLLFTPEHVGLRPQYGYDWAVEQKMFMSPLGIPCNQPPWGTISAIDLKSRKLIWQIPAGTIGDTGPNGIKTHVPVPIGMPTLGGPMTTKAGLVFYAGTQDYYLRALDVATGQELWKGRMPVGAQATPMTYISPASGRQHVVIVAGGARMSPDRGDYIIAYALPRPKAPVTAAIAPKRNPL
jgi:quinate dehydrogenase (quinone)